MKKTDSAEFKLELIRLIVDRWNSIHDEHLKVQLESSLISVSLGEQCAVGCLLERIAGVCVAFDWVWIVSVDSKRGKFIAISL